MVKRLLFLTLAITLVVHAQEVSNLRSWVKAATIIQVRIDGLYTQVPVNDSTNVMDVKKIHSQSRRNPY